MTKIQNSKHWDLNRLVSVIEISNLFDPILRSGGAW